MQEMSSSSNNKKKKTSPNRGRKRSSPSTGHDLVGECGTVGCSDDASPPSKISRTFSDDFESSRMTATLDQKAQMIVCQASDTQESISLFSSDESSTTSLALTESTATTVDMTFGGFDNEYSDDDNDGSVMPPRSGASTMVSTMTREEAGGGEDGDGEVQEEDDETLDIAWIESLREFRLDRALTIPNEHLVHTISSTMARDQYETVTVGANAGDAARFSNEICTLCRKPLVYSMNNEALTCPTEGCSPHVYNICDSTLASIAFGELVDFTYSATKQTTLGSRVCEEEIYGKKNKAYTNQDVINYLRVCIVKSIDKSRQPDAKIKSSDITANDIRAVCKAHGWTSLYSQGTQILCRMTGRKYPQISEHIDAMATSMFMRLKEAHQGARMKNCLYFWYKIYEILKQHHLLPFIRLVEEKPLAALDEAWYEWCDMLKWDKIPTRPRRKCVISPVDVKALLASLRKEKANVLEMTIEELMMDQQRQSHVV